MRSAILLAAACLGVLACADARSPTPLKTPDAATTLPDAGEPDGSVEPPDAGSDAGVDAGAFEPGERQIRSGPVEQVLPKMAVRPDGTAWLTWYEPATVESSDNALRLQKLDDKGVGQLGPEGIKASAVDSPSMMDYALLTEPSGDAVIAYSNTTDFNVRLQRVDARGQLLWGDGVAFGAEGRTQYSPLLLSCPDGSVLVAFTEENQQVPQIFYRKVDLATGKPVWMGPRTIVPTSARIALAQLVPGADGSFIIAWTEAAGARQPSDTYVQLIGAGGRPRWTNPVKVNGSAPMLAGASPLFTEDGEGGLYAAWSGTDATTTLQQGYVQHIDKDGVLTWPQGGIAVSTSAASHQPSALRFMHGKLFVAWKETGSGAAPGLYAQVFDPQGEPLFAATGLQVIAADGAESGLAAAVRPTSGGAALFYAWAAGEAPARVGVASIPFTANPSAVKATLSGVGSAVDHLTVGEAQAGSGYWSAWEDRRGGDSDIWGAWWPAP